MLDPRIDDLFRRVSIIEKKIDAMICPKCGSKLENWDEHDHKQYIQHLENIIRKLTLRSIDLSTIPVPQKPEFTDEERETLKKLGIRR